MTDDEIAKAVAEDPDAAPLDIDWTKARLVLPPSKESVALRVDQDVLDWVRNRERDTRPASTPFCGPMKRPASIYRRETGLGGGTRFPGVRHTRARLCRLL